MKYVLIIKMGFMIDNMMNFKNIILNKESKDKGVRFLILYF